MLGAEYLYWPHGLVPTATHATLVTTSVNGKKLRSCSPQLWLIRLGRFSMSNDGEYLDATTRDGFVLEENACGSGWRSELTGAIATQADLDATRPGALYGPDSTMPSFGEIRQALATFLLFGFVHNLAEVLNGGSRN